MGEYWLMKLEEWKAQADGKPARLVFWFDN